MLEEFWTVTHLLLARPWFSGAALAVWAAMAWRGGGTSWHVMRFPATLFHELAHFLAAALLGARPSRLSLVPRRLPADRMEMGAVSFEAHWSTAGLVALAPLVAGLATMALSWQLALEGDSAAYGAWFALGTVAGRPSVVDWALAVRYPLSGLLGLAACALVLVFGFQPP